MAAQSEEQNGGPISPGDLASIAEIGRGTFGIATAKHNQAVVADRMRAVNATSTSTGEQEAAYGKALGNCSTVAAKAEQAAPAGPVDLMKELTATFRDVEKTPAVAAALDAYGPCMTKAGFSAKSHVEIFQQAFDKFPRADLGVTAMENDPQWAAAVAYETEAAAADTTCLTPAQDLAFAAATPTLQAYVTKNRVALDAAKADLAELRR